MAAIAKFVSFDGGIAFSSTTLKIQKRDGGPGKLIPINEVAAVDVLSPLCGDDGSISVLLIGDRRVSEENTLYFDESQYDEAMQFKHSFDTLVDRGSSEIAPMAISPTTSYSPARKTAGSIAQRPRPIQHDERYEHESIRPVRQRSSKRRRTKKRTSLIMGVFVALIVVGGISLLFDKDNPGPAVSMNDSTEESLSNNETLTQEEQTPVDNTFVLDASGYSLSDIGTIDTGNLELEYGDLLAVNYGGDGVFVVKAKISPNLTNKLTIEQNFFSVCKLIVEHGFDSCSELQYWAVADMQTGNEAKVISFTLDKSVIQAIKSEQIVPQELFNVATDLWVLPSLSEGVDELG